MRKFFLSFLDCHQKNLKSLFIQLLNRINYNEVVYDIILFLISILPVTDFLVELAIKYKSRPTNYETVVAIIDVFVNFVLFYIVADLLEKIQTYKENLANIRNRFCLFASYFYFKVLKVLIILTSFAFTNILFYLAIKTSQIEKVFKFFGIIEITVTVLLSGFYFVLLIGKNEKPTKRALILIGITLLIIILLLYVYLSILIGEYFSVLMGVLSFVTIPVLVVSFVMSVWGFISKLFNKVKNFMNNNNWLKDIILTLVFLLGVNIFFNFIIVFQKYDPHYKDIKVLFLIGIIPFRLLLFLVPPIRFMNIIIMVLSFLSFLFKLS